MSRSPQQRVDDILNAIEKCERYILVVDNAPELAELVEDAIERNLQVIGEAAGRLPTEITDAHPEILWPQIRGFRNILVHQYFGVDIGIVRDVVETYLPPLAEAIRPYRGDED